MPTEVEELRLRITLDDQASAQLSNVRQQLSQMGSGPVGQGLQNITSKSSEAEKAFVRLTRAQLGVTHGMIDIAKVAGPWAGALSLAVVGITKHMAAMKEWAASGQNLANSARMAGTTAAGLKNVQEALARAGINAQDSAAMMRQMQAAISEAARPGSAVREGLMRLAGVEFQANMANAIDKLTTMKDIVERTNFTRQLLLNIYANNLKEHHDEARAREATAQAARLLGADQLMLVDEKIAKFSQQKTDNINAETEKQKELNALLATEEQTRGRIGEIIRASMAGPTAAVVKPLVAFEKAAAEDLERGEAGARANPNAPRFYNPNVDKGFLQGGIPGFQHGGIVTQPTMGMIGEAGPEAIIPLDKLGETKHTEIVGENTKQLRMLNDQMERILNPSRISRYAGGMGDLGGLGAGPGGTDLGPGGTSSGRGPGGTSDGTTDQPKSELAKAVDTGVEAAAPGAATAGGDGDYGKVADAIAKQEGYGANKGNIPTSQNNPGDLKWGPFAKAHGATGPGRGGHAIFPDAQTGRNALIALLQTKGKGQSIAQIGAWWAEDKNWASAVAKYAGLPTSFVPKGGDGQAARPPGPIADMKGAAIAAAAAGGPGIGTASGPQFQQGKVGVDPNLPFGGRVSSRATGQVSMDGGKYDFATGGAGSYRQLPFGDYDINFGGVGPSGQRQNYTSSGPAVAGLSSSGPTGNTSGFELHALEASEITEGCFGIRKSEWPAFKAAIQKKAQEGQLQLHWHQNPNGGPPVATITSSKDGPLVIAGKPTSAMTQAVSDQKAGRSRSGTSSSAASSASPLEKWAARNKALGVDPIAEARQSVDGSQLDKPLGNEVKKHDVDTSGTIKISHRGHRRAAASQDRPSFKDMPTNRQTQMMPANDGPLFGTNAASGI